MAATDKHYRNQKALDVVFGASCLVLLVTTFWMMYDDHNRAYKPIQRQFRDVSKLIRQGGPVFGGQVECLRRTEGGARQRVVLRADGQFRAIEVCPG